MSNSEAILSTHPLVVQNSLRSTNQQLNTKEIAPGDTRSLGHPPRTTTEADQGTITEVSHIHTHLAEMSSTTVLFSPSSSLFLTKPSPLTKSRAAAAVRCSNEPALSVSREEEGVEMMGRRRSLISAAAAACGASVLGFAGHGLAATQGLLAGRIPGLSEPDENGKFFSFIHL